ncbi:hypothetical protein SAMN04490357_6005 [Streptomyces misionensis]|uniref:Restriction endonuclease n=1 Tax=Streptomyces misionensis TaxID=67331 RepID=A0A1H5DXJ9_9ACTN|nr:DUF6415 family natural product biosynthesis protein [Streptomyces misionensis]SED83601.1 hypothetical protein SAMN04490357_6005 [Streptomyces misionensis]
MNPTMKQAADTEPLDIAFMRETAALLLGPEREPSALPPVPADVDTLILALRGHLELLIPEVEQRARQLPKDSAVRYCANACVGEARGKLQAGPSPRYGGEAGHARRLARVLRALCDHYENELRPTP